MSRSGNISPICGEAPTVSIKANICMVGNLADVITCAKFEYVIYTGGTILQGGGRISHFPIDFCMGLRAACDQALCVD